MTWIKVCGTTNLDDARAAVDAGADAVGFVFAAESPRRIEPQAAAEIVAQLPAGVEKIGVFVNELPSKIREIVKKVGLTGVQLHGEESIEYAAVLFAQNGPRPKLYRGLSIKTAFSVTRGATFLRDTRAQAAFDALVVDSGSSTRHGGTGLTFDWTRAQPLINGLRKKYKVIIAGGLKPENVAKAIGMFHPWGVDVASGLEAALGRKDHDKVKAFVRAVRAITET